ncbi:MAG: hypothetical protein KAQ98_11790 [Bacteriovoracaceae bacterium]|nr:hypothetical protein [Bacteriovoracaceae bacterium]
MSSLEGLGKILLLIKLDAESVFRRIKFRQNEYIRTMSLKRTREHLKDVFKSRYDGITIHDMKNFSEEIIMEIDRYYDEVENLKWYLTHTEDMPTTVTDITTQKIIILEKLFNSMKMYIEAELSGIVPEKGNLNSL